MPAISASPTDQAGTQEATLRALLVEDEIELGRNLSRYLECHGFTIVSASTLDDGLSILEGDTPLDVVVTDIYLDERGEVPGGHRIAQAARRRVPPTPVILLTGRPSLDAALEGLREQVFDFLTKPVSMQVLAERARRAVEEQRLQQRLAELEEVTRLLSRILPNAIEAKDPSTRGHSDRVADYADTLGSRCGLDDEERRDLRLASMLHDVGKIGVPEAILTKPGALTRSERVEIEKHPEIGFRILEPMQHFPRVRDWVFQHHEHWDGHGYPCGLVGDEVALPGRILILAEVFDALATARSYKSAWPRAKIADFFEEDKGSHFDPDLSMIVATGVREFGAGFFRASSDDSQQTLF
ncbi:MAG: hypothetical protein CMJ85_06780 [Planctomycetes bacterium]|jgi:putative two-component system response regulator|nr:hypothetical protein [Planctomycetota bacterium]MDP6423166.1 HD domain-containing phosphohydrolase [Planctomycetota bacterium]